MPNCPYCGQKAGFFRRQHPDCRELHRAGIQQMTDIVSMPVGTPDFSEQALRQTLATIAQRAYCTDNDIGAAIAVPHGAVVAVSGSHR